MLSTLASVLVRRTWRISSAKVGIRDGWVRKSIAAWMNGLDELYMIDLTQTL